MWGPEYLISAHRTSAGSHGRRWRLALAPYGSEASCNDAQNRKDLPAGACRSFWGD